MIRINLLPERETRRRKRAAVERAVPPRQVSPLTILLLAGMAVVLVGVYYFGAQKPRKERRATKTRLEGELKSLDKNINAIKSEVEILRRSDSITRSMLDVVYALDPEDRLLWSQKVNQVSDLVPANVFVTRITVTESIKKRETAESIRRTKEWTEKYPRRGRRPKGPVPPKPSPIYYPEVTQTLTILAIAYSENEDERIRLINQFYDNLDTGVNEQAKVKHAFLEGFTGPIQYGNISPRTIGGLLVTEFSFTLQTKPTRPKTESTAGGA